MEIDVPLIIEYFQERKEEKKEDKKPKKERKQVLDMKRANHIGLMLSMAKKKTYRQIRQGFSFLCFLCFLFFSHNTKKNSSSLLLFFLGIIDLDDAIFSEDLLRAFVKLTPQKTDIELLTPFKNLPDEEKAQLGDADQFFLEIMDIPRLEQRISAFLFKKTFELQFVDLKVFFFFFFHFFIFPSSFCLSFLFSSLLPSFSLFFSVLTLHSFTTT